MRSGWWYFRDECISGGGGTRTRFGMLGAHSSHGSECMCTLPTSRRQTVMTDRNPISDAFSLRGNATMKSALGALVASGVRAPSKLSSKLSSGSSAPGRVVTNARFDTAKQMWVCLSCRKYHCTATYSIPKNSSVAPSRCNHYRGTRQTQARGR